MVTAPDFRSWRHGLESRWRRNSPHDCMALHCTKPSIITLPLSQYDLKNVERDVKHKSSSCTKTFLVVPLELLWWGGYSRGRFWCNYNKGKTYPVWPCWNAWIWWFHQVLTRYVVVENNKTKTYLVTTFGNALPKQFQWVPITDVFLCKKKKNATSSPLFLQYLDLYWPKKEMSFWNSNLIFTKVFHDYYQNFISTRKFEVSTKISLWSYSGSKCKAK